MNILLTGASGFVGGHLAEKLLREGHHVYALIRNPKKITLPPHPQLHFIQGDLSDSHAGWQSQLPSNISACIHSAGIVHSYSIEDFYQVNTEGTGRLIDILKSKYPNMSLCFILISSLAAAGPIQDKEDSKKEGDPDTPVSHYGKSKKLAEEKLHRMAPLYWKTAIIRPPMVIGPRDEAILDIFKMVDDRMVIIPGLKGKFNQYSFVSVFDLIETITRTLNHSQQNSDFSNLSLYSSHPQIISFNELISSIKKAIKRRTVFTIPIPLFMLNSLANTLNAINKIRPHKLRLTPDKYFELRATKWVCSGQKSEVLLGQTYHDDLDQIIYLTAEYFLATKAK